MTTDSFQPITPVDPYTQTITTALNTGLQIYQTWKALQVHPLANEWVAGVQDRFGAQLSVIVDAKDAALRAGTATADDVYFAQQAVIQLWNGYQDAATQFAGLGPGYSQVIENSYKTLQPIITQILHDMDNQIAQLGGISTAARLGVNTSHYGILLVLGFLVLITIIVLRRI